jgi:protein-L-isoaspartate(D-aspartate) O-methyltransferase
MENNKPQDIRGVGMTSQRTRNRLVQRLRKQGIESEIILDVINSTPRHLFIDEALAHRAYEDNSLPIGFNQTISQPFVVARMTESLLAGAKLDRVLEIGTGSGYQTAILSQLVSKVYTVERIGGLLEKARATLRTIGARNVHFKHDDGNIGWADKGPIRWHYCDSIAKSHSARAVGSIGRWWQAAYPCWCW